MNKDTLFRIAEMLSDIEINFKTVKLISDEVAEFLSADVLNNEDLQRRTIYEFPKMCIKQNIIADHFLNSLGEGISTLKSFINELRGASDV